MQRQDLEIVDCLLPPQVRQVGGRTFLDAKTTDADYRDRMPRAWRRMGERTTARSSRPHSAYGRQRRNRATPEAQTVVGEIYEKGLGTAPDYARAASWYRKAADQGHARAQFNLGTLYEQGLGVEKDALQALNLYRSAGGLEGDVGYEEAYRRELERQRAELEKAIDERDRQIEALEQQIEELERKLEAQGSASAELSGQIASLNALLAQLRREREGSQSRLHAPLPPSRTREPSAGPDSGYKRQRPPTAPHRASSPGSVLAATTRS